MTRLLLLAVALAATGASAGLPCLPPAGDASQAGSPAIADHRALREALGAAMPSAPTMVMLFGRGGHLSTTEYSVVVVRRPDGTWHGTAVGRSRIMIENAPYTPIDPVEWTLDTATGRRLDEAIARRCPRRRADGAGGGPPPLGHVSELIDVVVRDRPTASFYASADDGGLDALIRPPGSH